MKTDKSFISLRARILLAVGSCLITLMIAELSLRLWMPTLGSDLFSPTSASKNPAESPFLYNDRIGYELKPFAIVESRDRDGSPAMERLNRDGFRGPEYVIPKPANTFRILAVGDSVVQGLNVAFEQTWEQVLERELNRRVGQSSSISRYEVINAGIGGYVSWQALVRLQDRGLKYNPDLVVVLVGWNDLIYSALPEWTPGIDLSKIERAHWKPREAQRREGLWRRIRLSVYRVSYIARLVRQARNRAWNARRVQALIRERQKPSGLAFNERALAIYVQTLEQIYRVTKSHGARMGLIVWPTILSPELLDDPDIHRRLVPIYTNFPLSTRELWEWYLRYIEAQRQFARAHPDIVLIDVAAAFADKGKEERLRMFPDLAHLTVEGNRALAEVIRDVLIDRGVIQ